jgi:two-component system nitrate/nitrite sensor histidine kinase NarX
MSLKTLKLISILLPPLIIGGFEYIRHDFLLSVLSMEAGNWYITLLTFILSFLFTSWMFRKIERINDRLAEEQARRAVYEERERLAQELHDNIAQMLFFLNVKLKQGKTDEARSAVSEIDNHLRQAIFNLRTSPSGGSSFPARVNVWLEEWSSKTGIEMEKRIDIPDGYFQLSRELHVFGIIQEACTNIRKHSRASRAVVELELIEKEAGTAGRHSESGWRLFIKDDGIGMPASLPDPTAYGLALLHKRTSELGAEMHVRSAPGQGTEIEIIGKAGRDK